MQGLVSDRFQPCRRIRNPLPAFKLGFASLTFQLHGYWVQCAKLVKFAAPSPNASPIRTADERPPPHHPAG